MLNYAPGSTIRLQLADDSVTSEVSSETRA